MSERKYKYQLDGKWYFIVLDPLDVALFEDMYGVLLFLDE